MELDRHITKNTDFKQRLEHIVVRCDEIPWVGDINYFINILESHGYRYKHHTIAAVIRDPEVFTLHRVNVSFVFDCTDADNILSYSTLVEAYYTTAPGEAILSSWLLAPRKFVGRSVNDKEVREYATKALKALHPNEEILNASLGYMSQADEYLSVCSVMAVGSIDGYESGITVLE
jgi:hypothetical protein